MTHELPDIPALDDQLQTLNARISEVKSEVRNLNHEISRLHSDIFHFENANILYRAIKPSTIPEKSPSTEEFAEMNEEHTNILRDKRDRLEPLRKQVEQLNRTQEIDNERYNVLCQECDDLQDELDDLIDNTRVADSEGMRAVCELRYVKDQIKERKNEIKMMQNLRREAEIALSQFINRADEVDGLVGGRIDSEKAILSLQNELRVANAELIELRDRIADANDCEDSEVRECEKKQEEHNAVVNWAEEREDLQNELREITQEIRMRKGALTVTENTLDRRQAKLATLQPLILKWRGRDGVAPAEDTTVEKLLIELDKARKERDERLRRDQDRVAELITNNARLEKEVGKSRDALTRVVAQFRADENTMKREVDELRAKSDAEEQRLLRQIELTKLKLAQNKLRREKKND